MLRIEFQYKAKRDQYGNAYNTHVALYPAERRVYICKSTAVNDNCVTVTSKADLEAVINKCRADGWEIIDR